MVAAFFADLTLVDPGLTDDVWAWRPDGRSRPRPAGDVMTVLGGVARKD